MTAGWRGVSHRGAEGLYRLIYFSRQVVQIQDDLDFEVDNIVRASIRNNRAVAVTGLLLIHQNWFVQALEGPKQAVLTTFGRIRLDRRNLDPTVIGAGSASHRCFRDWNMCARRMCAADDAILAELEQTGAFDPTRLTAETGLRLLTAIDASQQVGLLARIA
jgi:hypothetical protein